MKFYSSSSSPYFPTLEYMDEKTMVFHFASSNFSFENFETFLRDIYFIVDNSGDVIITPSMVRPDPFIYQPNKGEDVNTYLRREFLKEEFE